MNKALLLCLFIAVTFISNAQSKVFKEISEDVSSEMKIIMQDNTLVGYLVFTQLEKADADSFNYRISLMDENLNEIGTVNFKEVSLDLEAAAFEGDILCLTYLKSNMIGKTFKNGKEFENVSPRNYIFSQFLTLTGEIIKTSEEKIFLHTKIAEPQKSKHEFIYTGGLRNAVQLKNIAGKGFACFYGDKYDRYIINYDLSGNVLWKKEVNTVFAYGLLASPNGIYLLEIISGDSRKKSYVSSVNEKDGTEIYKLGLTDSNQNVLSVSSWGIDPVTGNPYLSGSIFSWLYLYECYGIFTIDLAGSEIEKLKKKFVYWDKGSDKVPYTYGYVYPKSTYIDVGSSFRDYYGNTWYVGKRKHSKEDLTLLRLNPEAVLSYEGSIDMKTKNGDYYSIENPGEKENYIVLNDSKNVLVYSIKKKTIIRTIPKKEGKSLITVFPAKEGHIMVVEKNKKEKYTRLSIETLN
jgi:hypothetical protein